MREWTAEVGMRSGEVRTMGGEVGAGSRSAERDG